MLAARNLHLTVVTNCLPVAASLGSGERCRVIMCPGEFVLRESGVFGADALQFIARFKADKAFIGAGGVTVEGVSDADSAGCAVKRAMMAQSDRTLLLLDSSKFGRGLFENICPWPAIDTLVTEAAPAKALTAKLKASGVDLVVAAP
jgi:DeoR/GlpR family transcriptional regulator of sugar metabolism